MGKAGRPARLELLCVGSELLVGQLNTHEARLGLELRRAGLNLCRASTFPDDGKALAAEMKAALARSDALIVCGGLGPTFDDVTREAASAALGRKLTYKPALYAAIERKYLAHRLTIPEENKRQAFALDGAEVLENRWGSAPGQFVTLRRGSAAPKALALLPGPTSEMAPIFAEHVLPRLVRLYAKGVAAAHLSVHVAGLSESEADEKLQPLIKEAGPEMSFTILSSGGQVDFHVSAMASKKAAAEKLIAAARARIDAALGAHVFGEGSDTLESVLGRELKRRGLTLAVAESCTGGLVGARITAVPGSSDYFLGGVLAYANAAKTALLSVSEKTLAARGAVSAECAREMAEGARRALGADVGLSITGVAGPSGGTAEKPVGLVYVCAALRGREITRELRLSGGRDLVRARAATAALHAALRLVAFRQQD